MPYPSHKPLQALIGCLYIILMALLSLWSKGQYIKKLETKESNLSSTGDVQIAYSKKPSDNEEEDLINSILGVLENSKVATKQVGDVKHNVT